MRSRLVAASAALLLAAAGCADPGTDGSDAGALVVLDNEPAVAFYSPESAGALALGLPDQVGGLSLHASDAQKTSSEESEYLADPRVRRILVDGGLGPARVNIEQKSAVIHGPPTAAERIPPVALAAAQVKDVPATEFIEWDPTFYLLVTSIDVGDYLWQGEKPDDVSATVAERSVRLADFDRFKVAWYAYGDVLYVVVAASDQLLEAAVRRLPWTADTT
jgi:hypothetical protein